ncbi:MAG: hypothetical protein ACM37W_15660 [Actinomycetota bacterium]
MNLRNFLQTARVVKPAKLPNLEQQALDANTPSDRLAELATLSVKLAQSVALNPNASSELLRALSLSEDDLTRKNVATNPNTPTEVLLELGGEFPEQLFSNPVFSLLFLENPGLFYQMPIDTLLAILQHEKVPLFVLELAVIQRSSHIKYEVAKNRNTPQELLHKLAQCGGGISYAVAENPNASIQTLKALANNPNQVVRVLAETNLKNRHFL